MKPKLGRDMWPWVAFNMALPFVMPIAVTWIALGLHGKPISWGRLLGDGTLYFFVFLLLGALLYDMGKRVIDAGDGRLTDAFWSALAGEIIGGVIAVLLYLSAQYFRVKSPHSGGALGFWSLIFTVIMMTLIVLVRSSFDLW